MVQRLKTTTPTSKWLGQLLFLSLSGITSLLVFIPSFSAISQQIAPPIAQQSANENTARQVLREASQLLKQGTTESIRQAIPKLEQAIRLSRQVDDKVSEAVSLLALGGAYLLLGEKQKSLECYKQALPLTRAVGSRGGEAMALSNIGHIYNLLGEKQKALEHYNQVLPLYRLLNNDREKATTLTGIASIYNSLGDKQRALEFYNQALSLLRVLGDRKGEIKILSNIGNIYNFLGEKRKALEVFNQTLLLRRAVEDRDGEAATLNNIGRIYDSLGEKQRALEFYNQALPLSRAAKNREGEATVLNNIGSVYDSLGEKQGALEFYNQALLLYRIVRNRSGEATTLSNIGLVYDSLGEKQKALEFYNQALLLSRAVGDRGGEATTLNNIGLVYDSLGEKQKALEFYNQVLPLARTVGDRGGEATTLSNIGRIYDSLGEKQKALEFYNQALPLLQAVGDKRGEATTLNNVGGVYDSLGEKQRALEFYNQALPLLQAVGDRGRKAIALNNIGSIYDSLGEKQKALEFYNQALSLKQAVGDKGGEANTLNNIGGVYNNLGQKQKALEVFNQALSLSRAVGNKGGEATTLNNIGAVYSSLGEKQKGLQSLNQALALYQTVGDRSGEAKTLYNFAFFKRSQGDLTAALTYIKTTITIIEELRTKIGSQDLRTSYFATVQSYYQFYIDLLMQLHQQTPNQGYDALALHTSERARARTLLEQLTEARLNLKTNLDPTLLAEEQRLTQALNTADQKRLNLLNRSSSNADLEAAKAEINTILQQLQRLEAQIRRANPAYANLKYPDPLTLTDIQAKILDPNTLLLQYALGEARSYLFLVSKTQLKTYTLPPRAELEAAVEAYRQRLQSPTFTDLSQGQPLSQMLLGQIASELKGQRLVIVGDGKLQLLPFAALPWGPGATLAPLLANHEIITLPSVTSLAVQREQWQKRPRAPKNLAVIADPVFKANDPRLGANARTIVAGDLSQRPSLLRNGCGDFDRLPHTATEAEQILSLVPNAQRFSATGFDANYTTTTSNALNQYQILHLATHGCIQDNPLLSNLALSFFQPNGQPANTSSLKLQDIYNLDLNADLVVLSACQTGIGKEVQGEGVVGLTRGFMYAGARRVVVSLWSVNDQSTAILMSNYYRQMLQQGLSPAVALQQAQLAMWRSDRRSAPYYWAAFTIQGDW